MKATFGTNSPKNRSGRLRLASVVSVAMLVPVARAATFEPPELSKAQQTELKANFVLCQAKLKGPYGDN